MDKYELLEKKLIKISECIDDIKLENKISMEYLVQYKEYVERLIHASHEKVIRNSDGALLGLIRGISDYDDICSCDELWNLVADADNFYSKECNLF